MRQELLELKTHFSFGENWSQYAEKIDETRSEGGGEVLDSFGGPGND